MQLAQNASESNVDNLNNVRREASRYFRTKKKWKIWKIKLSSFKPTVISNTRGNLIGAFNDFKKGYQPRIIMVKGEKGD
jgi:hypothetical protein